MIKFHTYGDSHAGTFGSWDRVKVSGIDIVINWLGPKTMYSFGRDKEMIIKRNEIGDNDFVCFCFGEIDCRAHINKYEPIILKSTNGAQYIFDISSNNKLNNIELSSDVNTDILDRLKEYVVFYNDDDKDHQIKTVLLNNNLSVNHFILNNDIIIQCDPIEPILLNRLFQIIQCNNIELYYEVMYKNNFVKTINLYQ